MLSLAACRSRMKMYDAHFYNAEVTVPALPVCTALKKRINSKRLVGHVSRLKCKRVTQMVDVARATVSSGAVTKACLSQECLSSIHTDRTKKSAMRNHLLVSTIETGEKY